MNAQTQNEARRILAVMDELLEDLAIVATLPPYLSAMPPADMQHLLDAFHDEDGGQEVQQQLTEHYDLERRLESASGDMTSDDVEDLHFSTRSLVDTMRYAGYPEKYRPSHHPSSNISNYRGIIQTLRGLLNDRLNTTVEDDVMKFAILNDTVNREKNASADVQALSREHQQEQESRRVEVERRNASIKKLKEELAAVQETAVMDRDRLLAEILRMQEEAEREYDSRHERLKGDVESIDGKYKTTRDKCVNDENAQRAARVKKETTLAQTIQHYDKEMTENTNRIKELQGEMDKDNSEMQKVTDEVTRLEAARKADEDEERLMQQRSAHTIAITNHRKECATIIQSFFRAHALRVAMANKGKKKGKGKKGK
jgi:peptidoglycan hydrolase CwlO-like protein